MRMRDTGFSDQIAKPGVLKDRRPGKVREMYGVLNEG